MVDGADDVENYWHDLGLSVEEFNRIADENSNFISTIIGYVAEERLREIYLEDHPKVADIRTPADHNKDDKGDLHFEYGGDEIRIEVKSIQSNHIEKIDSEHTQKDLSGNDKPQIRWKSDYNIKGSSDPREIEYKGEIYTGTQLDLENPGFDIMAVCMFRFENEWDFGFILPDDLPRTKKYSWPEELRETHSASFPDITLPVQEPYTDDLFELIDEIIDERS